MFEPLKPVGEWKLLKDEAGTPKAYPYVGVIGITYDDKGNFPMIFRGPNVRSAKNAWSLISGLHEIGLTLEQQLCTETQEEANLEPIIETVKSVGCYENIAVSDGYHWLMTFMTVRVKTLATLVNKEPEKHPEIGTFSVFDMVNGRSEFWDRPFTPGLGEALKQYRQRIFNNIATDLNWNVSAWR